MIAAAPPPRVALVPNAVAFRDVRHGVLGTGWTSCSNGQFGCRPQGTISLTSDGGRTWRVVFRTPRPVVWVAFQGRTLFARYDDGENIASTDAVHWAPTVQPSALFSPCPPETTSFVAGDWALCTTQGGAGNMGKSVYRFTPDGVKRVAYTTFASLRGRGGISSYGYPLGIAGADDGFALIWESRGTLYVTRNGGTHWTGLPRVARPEVDFGVDGAVLHGGVGWVILALGGTEHRRLLQTTDAGRTWHVLRRWH